MLHLALRSACPNNASNWRRSYEGAEVCRPAGFGAKLDSVFQLLCAFKWVVFNDRTHDANLDSKHFQRTSRDIVPGPIVFTIATTGLQSIFF